MASLIPPLEIFLHEDLNVTSAMLNTTEQAFQCLLGCFFFKQIGAVPKLRQKDDLTGYNRKHT